MDALLDECAQRPALHELLRQYAADKLAQDPVESEDAHERHARFYVGLLESRRPDIRGPDMAKARDYLRRAVACGQWDRYQATVRCTASRCRVGSRRPKTASNLLASMTNG